MPYLKFAAVYQIICVVDGTSYIGSSVSALARLARHRADLKKIKHFNPKLQGAFNCHGENSFVFEILERCSTKLLREVEEDWIAVTSPSANLYKICKQPLVGAYAYKMGKLAKEGKSQQFSDFQAKAWASCSKDFIVIEPNGKEHLITNLRGFCKDRKLTYSCLLKVAELKPMRHQHKGWRAYKCCHLGYPQTK